MLIMFYDFLRTQSCGNCAIYEDFFDSDVLLDPTSTKLTGKCLEEQEKLETEIKNTGRARDRKVERKGKSVMYFFQL